MGGTEALTRRRRSVYCIQTSFWRDTPAFCPHEFLDNAINALDAIERRYASRIGVERLDGLRSALRDLLDSSESDSQPLNM